MAVQFAAEQEYEDGMRTEGYPMDLVPSHSPGTKWVVDWHPMVSTMLDDLRRGCRVEKISVRFHAALAEAAVRVAQEAGLPRVVLSGGCFQNRLLLSLVRQCLEAAGFTVYGHAMVPPNDGGLSLGQAVVAASRLGERGNA
jgi:hydrogenase maturation protein HypF